MPNIWKTFDDLLPKDPLLIGTVTMYAANNTSVVSYLGGGTGVVLGQSVAIGSRAYIQSGKIQDAAPSLGTITSYEI